ncbi:MAG: MarR family transcriptional regulator [Halobacteria archaeon]|nr:MarR family transcriptional regulator [Halobacteria archaeon]
MNEDDYIRFLAGSPNRERVLDSLTENPGDVRDLRDRLDIPRTTLQKNIRELEEKGWVEKVQGGYTSTTVGEIIVGHIKDCREGVQTTMELEPFLKWVPASEFDIDIGAFEDSDITVPEPPNPRGAERRVFNKVTSSNDLKFMSPVLRPMMVETLYEHLTENEVHADITVSSDVIEVIKSDYPEVIDAVATSERVELREYTGDIPFITMIFEDMVMMAALDNMGIIRALVENESEEAMEHAVELYEEYAEEAVPVEEVD